MKIQTATPNLINQLEATWNLFVKKGFVVYDPGKITKHPIEDYHGAPVILIQNAIRDARPNANEQKK